MSFQSITTPQYSHNFKYRLASIRVMTPGFLQPTQQKGMFSQKKQEPQYDFHEVLDQVNGAVVRLRTLEERYNNLQKKTQITEENMLRGNKRIQDEVHMINSDIMELKNEIRELKEKLRMVVAEMKNLAQKEDVKVLQKYMNLWDPVNFVTHQELPSIVKDIIDEQKNKEQNQ